MPSDAKAAHPGGLRISTEPADVDVDWLHAALSERAYWALDRPRKVVEASLRRSLCFSALADGRQVGFARVVTDEATFAWVCDVFVDEAWRAGGVGGRLMAAIVGDPRLQGLRRMVLATNDAAGFYERFGFGPLDHPERWMER
jgi:N-acetylglutamate synthase-like GNAT family acetyltransferase